MEFKVFKNENSKTLKEYWLTQSEWDALDKTTVQDGDIYHIVGTIDKGDLSADVNASLAKADSSLQKPTATLAKESFVKVGIDGTQKFDENSYVVAPSTGGMAGQVLKKTATGTEWADESGGGSGDVTAAGNNVFTGYNSFKNGIYIKPNAGSPELNTFCGINKSGLLVYTSDSRLTSTKTISVPMKEGTLALTSDIDVTAAGNNTFTGANTFQKSQSDIVSKINVDPGPVSPLISVEKKDQTSGIAITSKTEIGPESIKISDSGAGYDISMTHDGFKVDSSGIYTKYYLGYINYNTSVSGVSRRLDFPDKSGTFALTSDIPIKTATLSGTTLSITLS